MTTSTRRRMTFVLILTVAVVAAYAIVRFNEDQVDDVPLPFATDQQSLRGAIMDVGDRGGRRIKSITFAPGDITESIEKNGLNIVMTPDTDDVPFTSFTNALPASARIFGYKYSSRNAAAEKAAAARAAGGEPLSFTELFPGTFFVSDAERSADSFISTFEQQKGISFSPLSAVKLERNARYVVITADDNVQFSARPTVDPGICGDTVLSTERLWYEMGAAGATTPLRSAGNSNWEIIDEESGYYDVSYRGGPVVRLAPDGTETRLQMSDPQTDAINDIMAETGLPRTSVYTIGVPELIGVDRERNEMYQYLRFYTMARPGMEYEYHNYAWFIRLNYRTGQVDRYRVPETAPHFRHIVSRYDATRHTVIMAAAASSVWQYKTYYSTNYTPPYSLPQGVYAVNISIPENPASPPSIVSWGLVSSGNGSTAAVAIDETDGTAYLATQTASMTLAGLRYADGSFTEIARTTPDSVSGLAVHGGHVYTAGAQGGIVDYIAPTLERRGSIEGSSILPTLDNVLFRTEENAAYVLGENITYRLDLTSLMREDMPQLLAEWSAGHRELPHKIFTRNGESVLASYTKADSGQAQQNIPSPRLVIRRIVFGCAGSFHCGNGQLQTDRSERCDDANRDSGDGCSELCKVEAGHLCNAASPSQCSAAQCIDGNDGDADGVADLLYPTSRQEYPNIEFLGESTMLQRAYFFDQRQVSMPLLKIYSTENASLLSERPVSAPPRSIVTDESRNSLYGIVASGAEDRVAKMNADGYAISSVSIRTGNNGVPPGSAILLSDDGQHAAVFTKGSLVSFSQITAPNGTVTDLRYVYDSVSIRIMDLNTFTVTSTFVPNIPSLFMKPVAMRGTKVWYLTVREKELWSETLEERVVFGMYDAADGSHTETELPYQALHDVDNPVVIGDTVLFLAYKREGGLNGSPYVYSYSINDLHIVGGNLLDLSVRGQRKMPLDLGVVSFNGVLPNGRAWGWFQTQIGLGLFTITPDFVDANGDLSPVSGFFGPEGRVYENGSFVMDSRRYPWMSVGNAAGSSSFFYGDKVGHTIRLALDADTECRNPADPE